MKYKAVLAFLAIFFVAIFLNFQISAIKDQIREKNAKINLLIGDYEEMGSEFTALGTELNRTEQELELVKSNLNRTEKLLEDAEETIATLNYSKGIRTYILGVKDGEGAGIPLEIELKAGTGRILLDFEDIYLEDEVQSTAKTAFELAEVLSGGNLSYKDATIRFSNPYKNSLSISGMSSGAAMAVGLIALGKDKRLKDDVFVTATINGDGTLGHVTFIKQKAEAAKSLNATLLLVPRGQKIPVDGIELIEISDIEEAMEYMLEH